jgi:parallel beta-helix repeat protein
MKQHILQATVLVAMVTTSLLAAAGGPVVMFVGPGGSAAASGKSQDKPLPDLQTALDKGLAAAGDAKKLEIRVLPGTYQGQTLVIKSGDGDRPRIEILRDAENTRPVFDGAGANITWLSVSADGKPVSDIAVFGLEVTRYRTAITLNGSRDKDNLNIGDVTIRNNIFRVIGQQSPAQTAPSTAAVRLVNADRVKIINNQFIDVRNLQRCGLIHAIYVAHGSTGNLIKDNTFENSCGDSIRFRDASGGNRVEGNTFIDAWAEAPISDWFCDSSGREDCTKKTPECPSLGNEVTGNKVTARKGPAPQALKTFGPDSTPVCPIPAQAQGAARQRFVTR